MAKFTKLNIGSVVSGGAGRIFKRLSTESAGASLITFTIDGREYQAEEGMLWWEWAESEYDTDGYMLADKVYAPDGVGYIYDVTPYDVIINGTAYTETGRSHSGGAN